MPKVSASDGLRLRNSSFFRRASFEVRVSAFPLEKHDARFGLVCVCYGLLPAGGVAFKKVRAHGLVILRQEWLQELKELRRAAWLKQPTAIHADQHHHRRRALLEITDRLP